MNEIYDVLLIGRYPKLHMCDSHYIKESLVTNTVIENIKNICKTYIAKQALLDEVKDVTLENEFLKQIEQDITIWNQKIETINSTIEKLYIDKINSIVTEEDFIRISNNMVQNRQKVLDNLNKLNMKKEKYKNTKTNIDINRIVNNFLDMENPSREVLCELIDRIELTKDKEIIINYNFKELENIMV